MRHPSSSRGFTLVELLLVLAILGIIAVIAIPSLTGQRARARRIGDAEANSRVLAMAMETRKSEIGSYGAAASTAIWSPGSGVPALTGFTANPAPGFTPSSRCAFTLTLTGPFTYTIEVREGSSSGSLIMTMDQNGAKTIHQK